nr:EOG090X0EYV [Ilyocryptus agilis]
MGFTADGTGEVYKGFTYFPRFPGKEEPHYEPSKVLMVQRIRTTKKKPYWDKKTLAHFGLGEGIKSSTIAIVANTPSNCAMLWSVKHLVRVTPITLPQGLPENGDLSGARLQENGALRFIPQLKSDNGRTQVPSTQQEEGFMDGQTLRKYLRLNWLKPW